MGYGGRGGRECPVCECVRNVGDAGNGRYLVRGAWIGRERHDFDHGRGVDGRRSQHVREHLADWFVEQGMNKVWNHAA